MKGKVLDYNIQESKGIISGDDGQRYSFESSEKAKLKNFIFKKKFQTPPLEDRKTGPREKPM